MHLALEGDVGVGDGGGKELAEGAKEEGDGGGDFCPLLDGISQLLKEGVLEDGVDDEDESGGEASKESLRALVPEQGDEGGQGGGGGVG